MSFFVVCLARLFFWQAVCFKGDSPGRFTSTRDWGIACLAWHIRRLIISPDDICFTGGEGEGSLELVGGKTVVWRYPGCWLREGGRRCDDDDFLSRVLYLYQASSCESRAAVENAKKKAKITFGEPLSSCDVLGGRSLRREPVNAPILPRSRQPNMRLRRPTGLLSLDFCSAEVCSLCTTTQMALYRFSGFRSLTTRFLARHRPRACAVTEALEYDRNQGHLWEHHIAHHIPAEPHIPLPPSRPHRRTSEHAGLPRAPLPPYPPHPEHPSAPNRRATLPT